MNTTNRFSLAATITGLFALTQADALQQSGQAAALTMQPMQGVSLDVGSDHTVSYFLNEGGKCRIVLTLAGEPTWDDPDFMATRFEATLAAGETTRYVADNGQPIDFDCESSAETVSIRAIEQSGARAGR